MDFVALSFLAGVLTVLSPCVLPLLPVVVGGTLAQTGHRSWRRAAVVTLALGVSVFAFTFLLKVSTAFIGIPQGVWEWLSGGILFVVGLIFIFPNLYDFLPGGAKANARSNQLMSSGFMRQSVVGDIIVGAALGPVFTTCSPTYFVVLATVLPLSLAAGLGDIFAYTLGLCLFLLLISLVGQRALERLGVAADPKGWVRRVIGVLFIVIALLVVTGSLARVEAPLYSIFDETKIENYLLGKRTNGLATTTSSGIPLTVATSTPGAANPADLAAIIAKKQQRYPRAPELVTPDAYLNTGQGASGSGMPITLAQYVGKKVILIDFWTYSCINCQRTLPYLKAWYAKYKDDGLVIIGVHTPEFAFERLEQNVAAALKQFGITYPVVLDNEYQTWGAYGNQYWPHEYLIDIDGFVVHDHVGEGDYQGSEEAIQAALEERALRVGSPMPLATSTAAAAIKEPNLTGVGSPETYFGAARNEYLGNGTKGQLGSQDLRLPENIAPNMLYLSGTWNFDKEFATNMSVNGAVEYYYSSKNVYFVASAPSPVAVQVWQDGKLLKTITVKESTLYQLVANPKAGAHTLKLIIKSPGLAAYTFTFG